MELGLIVLCALLALAALALLLWLLSLRASLREIADELDDRLRTDTNTLISISSGDRAVRALAARINKQLQALRNERLKLQCGDAELKTAIANVSHDLRTPLTAICGYLDLLEAEAHSEKSARYLAIIRERADAMRRMTEELLRYSVVASTADELHREPVCLNDVLEQSLAGMYGVFTARGLAPDIRMPEERIVRTLDAAALRRVFDNILNNAAKYSGGDLAVELAADGTAIFSNRADGLTRVDAERLFDRFYTVETAGGSTGLGLSIARLLTEKMGGHIFADSDSGMLRVRATFPAESSSPSPSP
ncbi:MAG: HAMP domain-containing sensor histidine kinase [Clostridia bacterium]|nr:HAMP domain-containing sensor histidine kinase [Clostridia bacterium]